MVLDDITECTLLLERYLGISISIAKAFILGKNSYLLKYFPRESPGIKEIKAR